MKVVNDISHIHVFSYIHCINCPFSTQYDCRVEGEPGGGGEYITQVS